jgi:hypothetical protein
MLFEKEVILKRSLVSADSRRTKGVFVTEYVQCEYQWEEGEVENRG